MTEPSKGTSPFYPSHLVPAESFVGRTDAIEKVLMRGAAQVQNGKPTSFYIEGEYGIGKSSLASYIQLIAEEKYALHPINVSLSGAKSIEDVMVKTVECIIHSGAYNLSKSEIIKEWLAKYIGQQKLFGVQVDLSALKADAPTFSSPLGLLSILGEVCKKLEDNGVKGVSLVLDEINGIASDYSFASFLKGLSDENSRQKVPLLLMLCGTPERRSELIQTHRPVERIFDSIIEIGELSQDEISDFYRKAFHSVSMEIDEEALHILAYFSAGLPKIMQILGEAAFWADTDNHIDKSDANEALLKGAEEIGQKYVNPQVYRAIKSQDYKSILQKIGAIHPSDTTFRKNDIIGELNENEKKKFDNFIQKMQKVNVFRKGEHPGEYEFNVRMVRLYIWLTASKNTRNA